MSLLTRTAVRACVPLLVGLSVGAQSYPSGLVSEGAGSYTTEKPEHRWGPSTAEGYDQTVPEGEPWGIYTPRQEQSPSVTQRFIDSGKPTSTHTFWASALWEFAVPNLIRDHNGGILETDTDAVPYSHWMTNTPFTMKYTNRGVNLTYAKTPLLVPYRYADPDSDMRVLPSTDNPKFTAYTYPARIDPTLDPLGGTELNVWFEDLDAEETLVDDYSDFSGSIVLKNPDTPESQNYVRVTMVNGSPFLHFEKNGLGDIKLSHFNGMRLIHESDGTLAMYLPDSRTGYAIFAPPGTTFDYVLANQDLQELEPRGDITVSLPEGAEHFSVAILPNELDDLFVAPNSYNESGYSVEAGDSVGDLPTHIEGTHQPLVVARLLGDFFREDEGAGVAAVDELIMDYRRHAFAFPVNTEFSFDYDAAQATVNSQFSVTSELTSDEPGLDNRSLMGLHRHHYVNMDEVDHLYTYSGPRGEVRVISGNEFNTTMDQIGILPNLPNTLEGEELDRLISYLEQDEEGQWPGGLTQDDILDTYYNGKELNWIVQIMHIARQAGREDIFDTLMSELKNNVEDWLSAEDWEEDTAYDNEHCNPMPEPDRSECYRLLRLENERKYFYYNEQWNAMIGYPANFGSDTELNDHHFHSGYIISAAAAIARYDSEWADDWKPMIDLLIKDSANWDRTDERFEYLRYFDIYNGYSLANGHLNMDAGGNQESSSESINFAQAVALWGSETGDQDIRDLGAFLYASEMQAAHQYWFDVDGEVFPEDVFWDNGGAFVREDFDRSSVGLVWHSKADYGTWFSAAPRMIAGINFLPITGASLHLGHMAREGSDGSQTSSLQRIMDRLDENTEFYAEELWHPPVPEDQIQHDPRRKTLFWDDLMWMAEAMVDPEAAASQFDAAGNYLREFDSEMSPLHPNAEVRGEAGQSRTHTYHWIYNLKALGRPVQGVTADTAHYAVFERDGVRTHVAYNPGNEPLVVEFSDGVVIEVAPGELSGGVDVELAPPVENVQTQTSTTGVTVEWQALSGEWSGASYRVLVYQSDGTLVVDQETTETLLTLEDLEPGTEYRVHVQSVYNGQNGQQAVVEVVTEVDLEQIPPVGQLRLVEVETDRAVIEWETLPPIFGDVRYQISVWSDGEIVEEYTTDSGASTQELSGLLPSTEYELEVVALVGDHLSETASLVIQTDAEAPACDATQELYCIESSASSVEISLNLDVQWADIRVTSPVMNGGYRMPTREDGQPYFEIDGLSDGDTIEFEFTYFTMFGEDAGPFSHTFTAPNDDEPEVPDDPSDPEDPTDPDEPGDPQDPPIPGEECFEAEGHSFCSVSNNGELEISVEGASGWAVIHHASGNFHMIENAEGLLSYRFSDLVPGDSVSVWFTVNRTNGAVDTDWFTFTYSESAEPLLPGVTDLSVTALTETEAEFVWSPPADFADEAGLSYRVYLMKGQDLEQVTTVTSPEIQLDGLTPGTLYELQVEAALDDAHSSPVELEFTTDGESPDPACGEPGDVCATDIDDGLRIEVHGAQDWATIHYSAGNFHMTAGDNDTFYYDITGMAEGEVVDVWLTVNTSQGAYNSEIFSFTR